MDTHAHRVTYVSCAERGSNEREQFASRVSEMIANGKNEAVFSRHAQRSALTCYGYAVGYHEITLTVIDVQASRCTDLVFKTDACPEHVGVVERFLTEAITRILFEGGEDPDGLLELDPHAAARFEIELTTLQ